MNNSIFLKLGGSLITDKNNPHTPYPEIIQRLALEIANAKNERPDLKLVLGHGSGSFGHVAAKQFGTRDGVYTPQQWAGFAEVWYQARELNILVVSALHTAGLPVIAIPPSAILRSKDGQLETSYFDNIQAALEADLIPVVYGDVIFDDIRGGTIFSTEDTFIHLAKVLKPAQILLCGRESGVWKDFPKCTQLISKITPGNHAEIIAYLGGSAGIDVTGGMIEKVNLMLNLVQQIKHLQVSIFSGLETGMVHRALRGETVGTVIAQ